MATFVYSPAIRVHIRSDKHGILDISDDITIWEVIRRTNTVSSFNFTLQNSQRKYDRVFLPGDVITVELKRITWMRVFTGTLNTVPVFSAWPQALSMSASCTLKKLQFWPWNPNTTAGAALVQDFINNTSTQSAVGDGGLSNLVRHALTDVTNWPATQIHIGDVPNAWFQWAQKTEQLISVANSMAAVLGPASIGNTTNVSGLSLPSGYKGLKPEGIANAATVYSTILSDPMLTTAVLQDRAALIVFSTILVESPRILNLANKFVPSSLTLPNQGIGSNGTSVGLFQQLNGWGTAAERLDPAATTTLFLHGGHSGEPGLLTKRNLDWQKGTDVGPICQSIQGSAYPGRYSDTQPEAQDIVSYFRKQLTTKVAAGISVGGNTSSGEGDTGTPSGFQSASSTTGDVIASVALNLITSRPPGSILYQEFENHSRTDPNPTVLDCSALVQWVLYHAYGNTTFPRSASDQYASLKYKDIKFADAVNIRGCLMYGTGNGLGTFNPSDPGQVGHTGISIGDGTNVAARTNDNVPKDKEVDQEYFNNGTGLYVGGLAPGVDYTKSATTASAAKTLTKLLGTPCFVSPIKSLSGVVPPAIESTNTSSSTADPFAELVSALTTAAVVSGNVFGGGRALINNQPFLPWVTDITNSSMRAFCSAPNGDFMAWFPDYFNVWGTAAIMKIKLIELKDFTVIWSDQQMVTHEFVIGNNYPVFDQSTGSIEAGGSSDYTQQSQMLLTDGIATMDYPEIFETIYGKKNSLSLKGGFVTRYLARFGPRPNLEAYPNIMQGPSEFYMALWRFMKLWSEQFTANVPMTFMPELWPGMLIQIDDYKFQAYVSEVVHRGSYGPQGGFTTTASIVAPASTDKNITETLFGVLNDV
jgi:cell wall-associated NlpC family hydrolase